MAFIDAHSQYRGVIFRDLTHGGNWDVDWQKVALRSAWRTEVGDLLRKAVNGNPEELTNLANQAEATFEEAKRLAELPPEKFRRAWGAVLKKRAGRNLIVSLAGGKIGNHESKRTAVSGPSA